MGLELQVLGRPGRDNALWTKVDSGQSIHRMLFDCGEGCLRFLERSEILATDDLFFSHFHLDHVAGFDGFFRRVYNRPGKPVRVWGPPGTVELMHHRFRSFWWNLHHDQEGVWEVRDLSPSGVVSGARFLVREGFAHAHPIPESESDSIWDKADCSVDGILLEHHGHSVGYRVREKARRNVRAERLPELGLKPGPWVKRLKEGDPALEVEAEDGRRWARPELEETLLETTPGASAAYLTDFLLDRKARKKLIPWLEGIDTLVCESQYRHADLELARKNCHATARSVAELARDAGVKKLVLMHLSDRYREADWRGMKREARKVFENASFPDGWKV